MSKSYRDWIENAVFHLGEAGGFAYNAAVKVQRALFALDKMEREAQDRNEKQKAVVIGNLLRKAYERGNVDDLEQAINRTISMLEDTKVAKTAARSRKASFESDMLKGYLETALWSSTDESDESGGEAMDGNYDVSDIDRKSVNESKRDIKKFLQKAGDLVFLDDNDAFRVGHDFWLNRNGHGAGFWDGDYPEAGKELDKIAERMGEVWIYVGDDGKIYID